ncbi:MAG: dienelactone hydrolase family protein [Kiloniellales bacterium]
MPKSQNLTLTADDGHQCGAYRADPAGRPRGGIVVIQEIFGVNRHIRAVCDGFAADGYAALAPALYDRQTPGVELDYSPEGINRGREIRAEVGWDGPVRDIAAAVAALAPVGRVGTVGYCWGGSLSWLAATRLDVACAVCYYGGQIVSFKDERPGCPVLMHFGEIDQSIPMDDVTAIQAALPEVPVHVYPGAGHGFNCDMRADFHQASADLARERTFAFFAEHIG